MNVLFAAFFSSVLWLSYTTSPLGISVLVILIWVFTTAAYTIFMWYIHAASRKLGPALIYDKNSGKLVLPRHSETFTKDDDIWFQCLTARIKDESGDWCSELNLVFNGNGIIQRWNLMRSIATINPFNGMECKLSKETGIRVVR